MDKHRNMIAPKNKHWAVIQAELHNGTQVAFVSLRDESTWEWNGGPSYCTGDYTILKDYGWATEDEKIDSFELDYFKNYCPIQESKEVDYGWVGPEGQFYACPEQLHDSLAQKIAAHLYNSLDGVRLLEKNLWVRIGEGYVVPGHSDRKITRKSFERLVKMSKEDNPISKHIRENLDWIEKGILV